MGIFASCMRRVIGTKQEYVYVVLSRWLSHFLAKRAVNDEEFQDHMNIFHRQQVEYLSLTESDAEKYFQQYANENARCNEDKDRYWSIVSVYLIRAPLQEPIEEGIINKEILNSWSDRYKQFFPRGIWQQKGKFYVV